MLLAAPAAVPEPIARLLRQVAHHAAHLGLEAALVGGAVRDLLLGHAPTDIDVAVGGRPADVSALADLLGRSLGGIMEGHAAFGTASLRLHGEAIRLDLAMRRREFYPRPGALPRVEPGTWEEDLARRDFTINAMAWPLAFLAAVAEPTPLQVWPRDLLALPEALPDLSRGLVRVLHDGSFCDDPTRLMRAARTAARLSFRLEPGTRALAEQAMHRGVLGTVTPRRIAQEIRLTARENTAWTAFALLDGLGVWKTLLPEWGVGVGAGPQGRLLEEGLAALKQVKAVRAEPWRARLLAWLDGGTTPHTASGAEAEAGAEAVVSWLRTLGWSAADVAVLEQGLRRLPHLRRALGSRSQPSALDRLLQNAPGETQAALFASLGEGQRRALRAYWQALREPRSITDKRG